jgi:type I restriction-modification system DNA methylase subunit
MQQRSALQSQIWKIANDVRGSVDGWDFKQYVLGTLFYRFISEKFYVLATPTLRQNHPAQHYNERNKIFSVGIFYSL